MSENPFHIIKDQEKLIKEKAAHIHKLICENDPHWIMDVRSRVNCNIFFNSIDDKYYLDFTQRPYDYDDHPPDRFVLEIPYEIVTGTDQEIINWWIAYSIKAYENQEFDNFMSQASCLRTSDLKTLRMFKAVLNGLIKNLEAADVWTEWDKLVRDVYEIHTGVTQHKLPEILVG